MLAALLLTGSAGASIVNVLTPHIGPPEAGFTGEIAAGVSAVSGNEDNLGFTGGVEMAQVSEDINHQILFRATGAYAQAYGQTLSQDAFAHARYRWAFHAPWIAFTFAQADHNDFRNLALRAIAGAGLERRLWRAEWTEASVGLSALAEYEQLVVADDTQGLFGRASAFFLLAIAVNEQLTLGSVSFFQPRLDDFTDWRALEQLSLKIAAGAHLGWESALSYEHDHRPPAGVKTDDLALTSGLTWAW
jgi:hypothetical protein